MLREIFYELVDYVALVKRGAHYPNGRSTVVFDPRQRMTMEQVRRYYHGNGVKAQIKFCYFGSDGFWPE